VQLLPSAAQQGAVRGILHEGVLECVFRMGRRSTLENQLSVHELRERVVDLFLRHLSDCGDKLVREGTTECCANLCDFPCWSQPIKPRQKRCVE
jgi:hypothetical protein